MDTTWWVSDRQLDPFQKDVIGLSLDEDHLVTGPPGSGKTNLLLLRANYLARSGRPNLAVLSFTRSLTRFIARGAAQYVFPLQRLSTLFEWERGLIKEFGGSLDGLPTDFGEYRVELLSRLQRAVESTGARQTFDTVLVDEAQDLLPAELEIIFKLSNRVFAVGDPRQRIYATRNVLETMKTRMRVTELKYHYRCGQRICEVADAIASTTAGIGLICETCNYKDAESSVERVRVGDFTSACEQLRLRLAVQLRAYPGELLAVGCVRADQVTQVRRYLTTAGLGASLLPDEDVLTSDEQRRVLVATLHKLKGLEFRAVTLIGLERISGFRELQKLVGYMAVTRARTSLVAIYAGELPGWLEQSLIVGTPPVAPPPIEDLFGGQRALRS